MAALTGMTRRAAIAAAAMALVVPASDVGAQQRVNYFFPENVPATTTVRTGVACPSASTPQIFTLETNSPAHRAYLSLRNGRARISFTFYSSDHNRGYTTDREYLERSPQIGPSISQESAGAAVQIGTGYSWRAGEQVRITDVGSRLLGEVRAEADQLCGTGLQTGVRIELDPQHPNIRRLSQQLLALAGHVDPRGPVRVSLDQR